MLSFLERFKAEAYALLRIVSGFMFSFHGMQKVLGVFSEMPSPGIGSQLWIGGIIELLGGAAILLGYRTRLAAFLCSGEMAVAYMQFHWRGHVGRGFFPALNHGELAALYCFVFLFIATQGSGKWALDRGSK
jgi:putative oxidoreductase